MSQEKFNFIMNILIGGILFIVIVLAAPRALDQWYKEQYEEPVKYLQKYE